MPRSDDRGAEPSLKELLADPVVRAVMKADGLSARDLIDLVESISRNWHAPAQPEPSSRPGKERRGVA